MTDKNNSILKLILDNNWADLNKYIKIIIDEKVKSKIDKKKKSIIESINEDVDMGQADRTLYHKDRPNNKIDLVVDGKVIKSDVGSRVRALGLADDMKLDTVTIRSTNDVGEVENIKYTRNADGMLFKDSGIKNEGTVNHDPIISIEKIDSRDDEEITYDVGYFITVDGNDIEFDGTLVPFDSGRSTEYKFEHGDFSDKASREYYDNNWEDIEEQILNYFNKSVDKNVVDGNELLTKLYGQHQGLNADWVGMAWEVKDNIWIVDDDEADDHDSYSVIRRDISVESEPEDDEVLFTGDAQKAIDFVNNLEESKSELSEAYEKHKMFVDEFVSFLSGLGFEDINPQIDTPWYISFHNTNNNYSSTLINQYAAPISDFIESKGLDSGDFIIRGSTIEFPEDFEDMQIESKQSPINEAGGLSEMGNGHEIEYDGEVSIPRSLKSKYSNKITSNYYSSLSALSDDVINALNSLGLTAIAENEKWIGGYMGALSDQQTARMRLELVYNNNKVKNSLLILNIQKDNSRSKVYELNSYLS